MKTIIALFVCSTLYAGTCDVLKKELYYQEYVLNHHITLDHKYEIKETIREIEPLMKEYKKCISIEEIKQYNNSMKRLNQIKIFYKD